MVEGFCRGSAARDGGLSSCGSLARRRARRRSHGARLACPIFRGRCPAWAQDEPLTPMRRR